MLGVLLGWLFETAWHAVVGLLMLAGLSVGAVFVLIKAVVAGVEHDRDRCECAECKTIRVRAYDKRHRKEEDRQRIEERIRKTAKRKESGWLTTAELGIRMYVRSRDGVVYQVIDMHWSDYGWLVQLRNTVSGNESEVRVRKADVHRPMWKRAAS